MEHRSGESYSEAQRQRVDTIIDTTEKLFDAKPPILLLVSERPGSFELSSPIVDAQPDKLRFSVEDLRLAGHALGESVFNDFYQQITFARYLNVPDYYEEDYGRMNELSDVRPNWSNGLFYRYKFVDEQTETTVGIRYITMTVESAKGLPVRATRTTILLQDGDMEQLVAGFRVGEHTLIKHGIVAQDDLDERITDNQQWLEDTFGKDFTLWLKFILFASETGNQENYRLSDKVRGILGDISRVLSGEGLNSSQHELLALISERLYPAKLLLDTPEPAKQPDIAQVDNVIAKVSSILET